MNCTLPPLAASSRSIRQQFKGSPLRADRHTACRIELLSGSLLLLCVQIPLAILRVLSALMRSDVLCESLECEFRAALRLKSLERSAIDPRLLRSSQAYGTLGIQTCGRRKLRSQPSSDCARRRHSPMPSSARFVYQAHRDNPTVHVMPSAVRHRMGDLF